MAVVHPCDLESLKGALMAAEAGLIDPILIGPEAKIRAVATDNGLDLKQHRIVERQAQPRFGGDGRHPDPQR